MKKTNNIFVKIVNSKYKLKKIHWVCFINLMFVFFIYKAAITLWNNQVLTTPCNLNKAPSENKEPIKNCIISNNCIAGIIFDLQLCLKEHVKVKNSNKNSSKCFFRDYTHIVNSLQYIKFENSCFLFKINPYLLFIVFSINGNVENERAIELIKLISFSQNTLIGKYAYFVFIIILLVIVLFTFLIYFGKNIKNKSKQEVHKAIQLERKRIGIELHDGIGQMLSTTKLYLSGIEETFCTGNAKEKMLFNRASDLLDETLKELKNISLNILPDSLAEYGLQTAIYKLIQRVSISQKLKITFENNSGYLNVDKNISMVLYRIVQECMNNTIKHSEATELHIVLTQDSEKVRLQISDNGKGVCEKDLETGKGLGWGNILSRLKSVDGKVKVKNGSSNGTTFDFSIPFANIYTLNQ